MKPSSPVARQVAPSKTTLQTRDSHAYSVLREELLARGSAMCARHSLVTLSTEFADADTAQKAHYCPILITDLIIGASLLSSTHVISCATDFSPLYVHTDYWLPQSWVEEFSQTLFWEHRIDFNFVGVLDSPKNSLHEKT